MGKKDLPPRTFMTFIDPTDLYMKALEKYTASLDREPTEKESLTFNAKVATVFNTVETEWADKYSLMSRKDLVKAVLKLISED